MVHRKDSKSFQILVIIFFVYFLIFIFYLIAQNRHPSSSVTQITPTVLPTRNTAQVTKVIDGDTIEIETGQRIRYIGIDTPEVIHYEVKDQCYGPEAREENRRLVQGKVVQLEKDVSEIDKYGRLLRYVYLPPTASSSAIFVNEYLVREGYARVEDVQPDTRYSNLFHQVQQEAIRNRKGLWVACL